MNKIRLTYASAWGAIAAIWFVTAVTIVAELKAPLKDFLKSLTGHHWTSKSILSFVLYVVIFVIVYLASKNPSAAKVRGALNTAILSGVLGSLILLGFFVWHTFGK